MSSISSAANLAAPRVYRDTIQASIASHQGRAALRWENLEMTRNWILTLAMLCPALALPAQRFEAHWYQPHLLSDAAAASDRIQTLSAHFLPVSVEGANFYLEEGYSLVRAEANPSGLQLAFRKGSAARGAGAPWSPEAATPPGNLGKSPLFTTIVYHEISYLEIWRIHTHHGEPDWCVAPVENLTARNDVLCLASREDAQSLADALATLAKASGATLVPPLGLWAEQGIAEDRRLKIQQTGWLITRVDPDGPPARAGLLPGDLIYKVNNIPCPGSGSFFSAFRTAAWPAASSSDDVRVEFFRGSEHLSVIAHYSAATEGPQ